jgi:uncharacterized protein YjbI with pentapeptide repeats
MGKHSAPVEQEKKPSIEAAAEQKPRKQHWRNKLWEWTDFGEKKLWDWLQLLSALAIPVVLAVAGFWFTAQQAEHQQEIEQRRAAAERALEEQRAQDTALQAYLDQMSALMLEEHLRNSDRRSEARTLARARTLTVLERLDPKRKRSVVQFLYESSLIDKDGPIVSLSDADLSSVDLRFKDLIQADLSEADLSEANLSNADLTDANLNNAVLSDADLPSVFLKDASLAHAHLTDANLSYADLSYANLTIATLTRTDFRSATLRGADLSGASLLEANMRYANLSSAQGITKSKLQAQYVDLKDATMLNGEKNNK